MDGCPAPPGSAAEGLEGRNIEVDFGCLAIFKQRTRLVTFMRPLTQDNIRYSITRNKDIELMRANFALDHHQGVLAPGRNLQLLVTYQPIMRSERHLEVFDYSDSDGENIKITVKGVAEGPRCLLSANRLQFRGRGERKVELRNDSPVSAHFQVDHPEGDVFQVQPSEGVVQPNSYVFLGVRFCPPRDGVFVRRIFCLVWNCAPLMLNVVGGVGAESTSTPTTTDVLSGFAAYFEEGAVAVDPPTFDVGYAPSPATLPVTVTNRSAQSALVDWRQLKVGRVSVTPPTLELPPFGRQQIQLQLGAVAPHSFLHETLLGQVEGAPYCLSLQVQAHGFPANQEWVGHVQLLPDALYWAPCAPGEVASSTLLLRNHSHLPAQFRLESPKATRVTAKPQMGVFRRCQIVVMRLRTEEGVARTYTEAWQVVVNGRARPFYLHGQTCAPRVEIGRGNRIDVGPVQDGSRKAVEVPMRNASLCPVEFHFEVGRMVGVAPSRGRLPSNETLTLVVTVTGSQCAPPSEQFCCVFRIVDATGAVTGHPHYLPVDVVADCSFSQLCACPSSEDLGRVPFGHRLQSQFDASNFGNTAVYFQACQSGDDQNVHIRPSFGEVKPRATQRFMVGGVASIVGEATLHFGYYNRMVKDSPLVTGLPTTLFTLSYVAEFPVVQLEGVVEHNFGPLFGNGDLYNHLGVAALNHALRHVANDQTLEHRSRLPEMPVAAQRHFWVRLSLVNVSEFDTDVTLKRLKLCDCVMQEVGGAASKRRREFQCPHRHALSFDPLEMHLAAGDRKMLNILVKYGLAGATPLGYTLQLSNKRTVAWHFEVYGVGRDVPRLSTYTPTFAMELAPVSLGAHQPPLQCFWFYNNSARAIGWQVEVSALQSLQVLNPVDRIMAQARKPLLVKFQPVEEEEGRIYSVKLAVSFGFADDPERTLQLLEVHGGAEPPPCIPPPSAGMLGTFPASLSADWLAPPPLPTWSSHVQLVFLKNTARNQVVQYTWGEASIEGALEVRAEPPSGLLLPKEIHAVEVEVRTLATPCVAQVLLPCQLVQYSDALLHQLTEERHLEAQRRIDEFMLDEPRGAKRPTNPIRVVPEPPVLFAALALDVASVHPQDWALRPWEELAQHPPDADFKGGLPPVALSLQEASIFSRVLEQALAQVVLGESMKSLLGGALRAPPAFYSQFTPTNPEQRERFHQPNLPLIGCLLRRLIRQSLCPLPQAPPANLNASIVGAHFTCRNQQCTCRPPSPTSN